MSKDYVKIIEDLSIFNDRVDEIRSDTSYNYVLEAISKIKQVLNSDKNYVALCAPQIGYNLRLFVVKKAEAQTVGDSRYDIFLNPMVVSKKGTHLSRETNLSIPNTEFIIPRYNEIHVAYQEKDGRVNSKSFIGAYGEIVQQMIEMLDGITLYDYGFNLNEVGGPEEFDKASKEDKEKVIEMYLNTLPKMSGELEDEIKNNPVLKNLEDTIKFNQGLLDGSIKPLDKDGNVVEGNKEE